MGISSAPSCNNVVIPAYSPGSVLGRHLGRHYHCLRGLGILRSDPSRPDPLRGRPLRPAGVVVWSGYAPHLAFRSSWAAALRFRDPPFLMVLVPCPAEL